MNEPSQVLSVMPVLEFALAAAVLLPLALLMAAALYLWGLLLAAVPGRSRLLALQPLTASSPASAPEAVSGAGPTSPAPWFLILIPAHNEELVLEAALSSLQRLDYPTERFDILVIADNCDDSTADIAVRCGAFVAERHNETARGKGYALAWALDALIGDAHSEPAISDPAVPRFRSAMKQDQPRGFDAVVVLDADTLVAPNLLKAFAARLAEGERALQARYEVLNVHESWRTRLMSCALALAHLVKPMGRERLSLSDGLKGNGMCFARSVVEAVPWSGESITEDIDYTIRLCRAGVRVAFVPETAVWAQMPTTAKQSASQRKRWEGGRYHLIFKVAPALLAESARRRSRVLFDRAIELLIPPFAEMFAVPSVLLWATLGLTMAFHSRLFFALSLGWCTMLLLQAGYLALGLWVARVPMSVAMTALYAPGYIVWKFSLYGVMIVQRSAGGWMRTERRKLSE